MKRCGTSKLTVAAIYCCLAMLASRGDVGAQRKAQDARLPAAPVTWSEFTAADLSNAISAGAYSLDILRQFSARRGVPLAWEYVYALANVKSPGDLSQEDKLGLSRNRNFWATCIYLMERDTTIDAHRWVATVWRAVRVLPDDCSYQASLFDAGGGELLKLLFDEPGKVREMTLNDLLAPLPHDELTAEALASFWQYFTSYGGDEANGDPLVELDLFAAVVDLDPSYRAKWRSDLVISASRKAFQKWSMDEQWRLALDAVAMRSSHPAKFRGVRADVLSGKLSLAADTFKG
ncbi:MAG: hypothetical protein KF754_06395 [Planctomycetes bacterium]|nr:hypothetical protein [Planctomycetota bacterium]